MPNQPVKFTRISSTKFEEITKESNTLYFLTDTHQIFLGDQGYVPSVSGSGLDYKGTLGTGGDYTDLPTQSVKGGEVYRVLTSGTFAGKQCSVGDVILAIKDDTVPTNDTWAIITNVDVQSIIQQAQAHWAPIVEPQV